MLPFNQILTIFYGEFATVYTVYTVAMRSERESEVASARNNVGHLRSVVLLLLLLPS